MQHEIDELCREHDKDYGIIAAQGSNPYTKWNWADKKFALQLRKVSPETWREYATQVGANLFVKTKEISLGTFMRNRLMGMNQDFKLKTNQSSMRDHFISEIANKNESDIAKKLGRSDSEREEAIHMALRGFEGEEEKRRFDRAKREDMGEERTTDRRTPQPRPAGPPPPPGDEPEAFAAAARGGSHHLGHETQPTLAPEIARPGFQNTHTVEIDIRYDLLGQLSSADQLLSHEINMTSYWKPHTGLTTTTLAASSATSQWSYQNESGANIDYAINTGDATASRQYATGGWTPLFQKLYNKYAVLGCYYEVTFKSYDEARGEDLWIGKHIVGKEDIPVRGVKDWQDYGGVEVKRMHCSRNT
ncbi:MAG: hypothetical protein ACPGYT_14995, partial [Nitrospirales bacterium]